MRISDWSSDVCSSDLIEADQPRAIARGKFGKPADRDHRVEQGHVGAIGQRRWLLGGADDADLLAERAREILDDHRDDRLLDILAERDLHVIGEHRRGLADRGHVADERRGDAPVGPYLHLRRQLGIAPDEDVALVERADHVLLAGYLLLGDEGRRRRSEEHTSELQSLMRSSYAVFCLTNKNNE